MHNVLAAHNMQPPSHDSGVDVTHAKNRQHPAGRPEKGTAGQGMAASNRGQQRRQHLAIGDGGGARPAS